jgi:glycerol uptake facilitator-like aquaporin
LTALRGAVAELLGTAFLLAAVVGSGIMAERLCDDTGLALLVNAIATGGALFALIVVFAPVSGAHLNPAVSLALALDGSLSWRALPHYLLAQILGAVLGVLAAHMMFGLPPLQLSGQPRGGTALAFSECVATLGLLSVVLSARRSHTATAAAVAAYITGAYWFTASTSFANPAVTLARTLTDSFAGIRLQDAPPFVLAQLLAVTLAVPLWRLLRGGATAAPAARTEHRPRTDSGSNVI